MAKNGMLMAKIKLRLTGTLLALLRLGANQKVLYPLTTQPVALSKEQTTRGLAFSQVLLK
jgi:hypothetical protein